MLIIDFQLKYRDKGGVAKLTELRSLFYSQNYIAKHFGVTSKRVKQWMVEFFGNTYDPRSDREEAIISNMVEFARNNSRKDFNKAFVNSSYYQRALQEISKEKIYDNE